MGTKEFNWLDKLIARMRLGKVLPYIRNDHIILDFGCGHQAYLLNAVKDRITKGVGIDYDAENMKIGNNIEIMDYHFIATLPFAPNSFNTIFSLAVIEHIIPTNVPYLFKEFNRILKPGGKVVVTTPTTFGKIILEFLAFRCGILSEDEVRDHKKYYSLEDLKKLAKKNDFSIEKYEKFQFKGNSLCVFRKKR